MPAPTTGRRFSRLLLLGLIGVASLPLVVVPMIAVSGAAAKTGMSVPVLTLAALAQPLLLLIVAALVGAWLAPRVGGVSYVGDARPGLRAHLAAVGPQALLAGLVLGVIIVGADTLYFRPQQPEFFHKAHAAQPPALPGLLVGLTYGGITEEILLRWGLMTLLVWLAWRLTGRSRVQPGAAHWWFALLLSAVLFGAGHLPAVLAVGHAEPVLIVRVVLLNAIAGVVYGWLYWRRSLEAAMLAHAATHVAFAVMALAGAGH